MNRYKLNSASQNGTQWDGSRYIIQPHIVVEQVTNRWLRDNLFRVVDDGRIIKISKSIIDRYFIKGE